MEANPDRALVSSKVIFSSRTKTSALHIVSLNLNNPHVYTLEGREIEK